MATPRETRALSAPMIYLDGFRVKIIPNTLSAEMPGEVKSRAVSAGGGSIEIVHGYDAEASVCKVKFEVANTAENVDLAKDYKARAKITATSTIRIDEDTEVLHFDSMVLGNRIEIPYEPDGKITFEFNGRYVGI